MDIVGKISIRVSFIISQVTPELEKSPLKEETLAI
jgi:hypothetical protein